MRLEDSEAKTSSFLGAGFPSHKCEIRCAHREGEIWIIKGLLEAMPYYWYGATETKSFMMSINDNGDVTSYRIVDDLGQLVSTATSSQS